MSACVVVWTLVLFISGRPGNNFIVPNFPTKEGCEYLRNEQDKYFNIQARKSYCVETCK